MFKRAHLLLLIPPSILALISLAEWVRGDANWKIDLLCVPLLGGGLFVALILCERARQR